MREIHCGNRFVINRDPGHSGTGPIESECAAWGENKNVYTSENLFAISASRYTPPRVRDGLGDKAAGTTGGKAAGREIENQRESSRNAVTTDGTNPKIGSLCRRGAERLEKLTDFRSGPRTLPFCTSIALAIRLGLETDLTTATPVVGWKFRLRCRAPPPKDATCECAMTAVYKKKNVLIDI